MHEATAQELAQKIWLTVMGVEWDFNLEQAKQRLAKGIKLPTKVRDVMGDETWTDETEADNFITCANSMKRENWELGRQHFTNLAELKKLWQTSNLVTTERVYDSSNVARSDTIYGCENIWQCSDCAACKNALFCRSCRGGQYILSCERSGDCNFCIRTKDSGSCSNCYQVTCSSKISNSLFIQDCSNLHECLFCTHMTNRRFYIANMPFEREEYMQMKRLILGWITTEIIEGSR